ncbi:MAG: TRAP transporter small permease subunit [Roseibium sp.]|uniref:TRAP transporter small permease n=1 Tax=Roseibium sp. TaxID=1936156 RepID=UPI0026068F31|nr:TRAP transporter small permease subunit [Roseibium sp.]MCV0425059.1 TRAP transporter small permease subunit [Roseibium sp.]
MDFLIALDRQLTRILEWLLIALFAVFLVLVCLLVVLRYGFSSSIYGGNEFITIAFLFTSAIGGAVCITKREHIAITFFIDMLPYQAKKLTYILGLALVGVINGAMVYYSIGWISLAGHNPWQPFGWPQGLVHASVPIGCGLAVFYCVVKIILTAAGRESIDILWMPED